jgi:hypothetical protein
LSELRAFAAVGCFQLAGEEVAFVLAGLVEEGAGEVAGGGDAAHHAHGHDRGGEVPRDAEEEGVEAAHRHR